MKLSHTKLVFVSILIASLFTWIFLHTNHIFYGTSDVFVYRSYVGDEQSPIVGALTILANNGNPLALRSTESLYYGPLFATLGIPAVVIDFVIKYVSGTVQDSTSYELNLLFDWGTILPWARIMALASGFAGLLAVYHIALLPSINPSRKKTLAFLAAGLVAINFYYFEYTSFFRHWAFIVPLALWQLYLAIRIYETAGRKVSYWFLHGLCAAVSFGISYFGVVYTALTLLPVAFRVLSGTEARFLITRFVAYTVGLGVAAALIIWWFPFSFLRLLGLLKVVSLETVAPETTQAAFTYAESLHYYLSLIAVNHVSLLLAIVILLFLLRRTLFRQVWFYLLLIFTLGHFVLFTALWHFESRYILPTIIGLVILCALLWVRYVHEEGRSKVLSVTLVFLLLFYAALHGAHIWKRAELYGLQPSEQRATAIALDVLTSRSVMQPTLWVADQIVGHPHTVSAYQNYVERFDVQGLRHYDTIVGLDSVPVDSALFTLYIRENEFFSASERQLFINTYGPFSLVVLEMPFTTPRNMRSLNDFLEENLFLLWWAEQFEERFFFYRPPISDGSRQTQL